MVNAIYQRKLSVTVVIPTFNHAHFLSRSLKSVLNQTYSNFEVLVVDNHSEDNTDELVKSFCDARIRLIKIHNHGVIAASRNLGIRYAQGDWVAFLDSDDFWYPEKLEVMMTFVLSNNNYDVISTDELMVNANNGSSRTLRHGPYEENFYKMLLVFGNRLSPSATMVRRTFLESHKLEFNESLHYVTVEDYDLWLRLAYNGARFKFISQVQGVYLIHGANSSMSFERHWRNHKTLLNDHVFNFQKFDNCPNRLWKRVSVRLELMRIKNLAANKEWRQVFFWTLITFISSPINVARYILLKIKVWHRIGLWVGW